MAFRIGDCVERGWLDASVKGKITGEIWLRGRKDPLRLDLNGYPMADLAGRMLSFENPEPLPEAHTDGLSTVQNGTAGDITASRKALHGDPPYDPDKAQTANVLYIEWFSEQNGRVVIEAVRYTLSIHGDALWHLTDELEETRRQMVTGGMTHFMEHLADGAESMRDETDDEDSWTPMDEYEWEKTLKESDERTEKYGRLLEQYKDHPDQERIIAREMGWDHIEDMLDADERGVYDDTPEEHNEETYPELTPNPETEGVDWIRADDGDIRHPLAHRAFEMSIRLHRLVRDLGAEDADQCDANAESLQVLSFAAHMLSAKLAGALNSLGYDREIAYMAGMIVAQLKRALSHFNEAIHRLDDITRMNDSLRSTLTPFREELFAIREEMLRLMERYRKMIR